MTVPANTVIFFKDDVYNESNTTNGFVQYFNAANGILDINNLSNTSNFELEFQAILPNQNLRFVESNTKLRYISLTNVLYLARPPEPDYLEPNTIIDMIDSLCCGANSPLANSITQPIYTGCWGFQPGDCVEQRVPEQYETFELTDDQIKQICNSCGCGTYCSCTEEEIESIRYIRVKVGDARLVQATVVREDCANNALFVENVTGKFVKNIPICKCGGLSDEDIVKLCEGCGCGNNCECTEEVINNLQFIQPCADLVGVFADTQEISVIEGDYLVEREQWNPLGPFIAVDKHFIINDDYSDKYLILVRPEIKNSNPVCVTFGDNGNGNRW